MEPFAPGDTDACPGRDMLIRFSLGDLPSPAQEEVTAHVLFCSRCCAVLDELRHHPDEHGLLAAIKSSFRLPALPEAAACARLAVAARALGAEAATVGPTGATPGMAEPTFVPRTVGPYLLLDRIGEGGMGAVYRARQLPLNREVAVKMILAGAHASPQAVARFRIEAEAVARLKHPNVVEIYDFDEYDGQPYFAMELVQGGSLADRLARGPLPPRLAAELARALAAAVESAHQKGVLHRDLKPANVLLTLDGVPKITDFGLAKLVDADRTPSLSGLVMGTPNYMAPEQADGRTEAIGPATDVYGLGAILYAALTGRPPFRGDSPAQTYDLVRKSPPTRPARLRPEVPWQLEEICLKCLEKEPARRYPSALALADDLGRWLRDERPRDTPRWPERAVRALRRRRIAVGIGLAFFLVFLAGTTVGYLFDPERPLRQMQNELAAGRPVTLIGETGKPSWFRWRTGQSRSQVGTGDDGTFTIQSWTVALLELLPDPQWDSYRFTAQVRHDKSDAMGEVGLFIAHRAYPGSPTDVQFFTQLTFNAVRGHADLRATPPDKNKLPPRHNVVELFPHLYSEESPDSYVDRRIRYAYGPHFQPLGDYNGRWHELEVVVTPAQVTARWNGETFSADLTGLQRKVSDELRRQPLSDGLLPAFEVRGGLGLYVWNGAAAFRAVTVTPLPGTQ